MNKNTQPSIDADAFFKGMTSPEKSPCFRGYVGFEEDEKPAPPIRFKGEPIPLASKGLNLIHEEPYRPTAWWDEFYSSLDCPVTRQYAGCDGEEVVRCLDLHNSDIDELVVLTETLWIGLRSMVNELANAPEALEYFRERIADAVSCPKEVDHEKY